MKTTIQSIFVAVMLAAAAAPAIAATTETAAESGATSVSEMMQRKHEHQLRARLVAEGRLDELRKLDEEDAGREREKNDNRYTRANEALSHGGHVKGADDVQLLNQCAPEKLHL